MDVYIYRRSPKYTCADAEECVCVFHFHPPPMHLSKKPPFVIIFKMPDHL